MTPVQPGSIRDTVSTLHGLSHGEDSLRDSRNEAHVVLGCRGSRHELRLCRRIARRRLEGRRDGARPALEDPQQLRIRGGQVDIESALASAEYAFFHGSRGEAGRMAERAQRLLKRGSPGWLRAADILNAIKRRK